MCVGGLHSTVVYVCKVRLCNVSRREGETPRLNIDEINVLRMCWLDRWNDRAAWHEIELLSVIDSATAEYRRWSFARVCVFRYMLSNPSKPLSVFSS